MFAILMVVTGFRRRELSSQTADPGHRLTGRHPLSSSHAMWGNVCCVQSMGRIKTSLMHGLPGGVA